jgi:hypothetical protein
MNRYDPNNPPDPTKWLELDEQERISLIERFHHKVHGHAESRKAHSVIHAIVETQLAMNDPASAREALARLTDEGLDRHEAIHALGSILAEHLFEALHGSSAEHISNEAYAQALSKLTATTWRSSGRSGDH